MGYTWTFVWWVPFFFHSCYSWRCWKKSFPSATRLIKRRIPTCRPSWRKLPKLSWIDTFTSKALSFRRSVTIARKILHPLLITLLQRTFLVQRTGSRWSRCRWVREIGWNAASPGRWGQQWRGSWKSSLRWTHKWGCCMKTRLVARIAVRIRVGERTTGLMHFAFLRDQVLSCQSKNSVLFKNQSLLSNLITTSSFSVKV